MTACFFVEKVGFSSFFTINCNDVALVFPSFVKIPNYNIPMSFEISGRITEIFSTQQITDTFKKREFILEIKESGANGMDFIEYIKFQTIQDKCALLDELSENDVVKVSFNLKGRKWEKDGKVSYFTNLDAWRIEKATAADPGPALSGDQDASVSSPSESGNGPGEPPVDDSGFDDLPF
jgi:hypothetical protein